MEQQQLKKIYYLASTHWDREWYRTFQGFRYRLVGVMDRILEVLEADPAFETFMLDGQTIVLDDFTEIEPENRKRLEALLREGRLMAGPWYVMPDESIVSGESLVQNLLLGKRTAAKYGAPDVLRYGYICDIFGHTAQMPQILRKSGIRGALLGRGTNYHTTPAHFRWQSPDGSECITFKVPEECGYGTFWMDTWLQHFLSGGGEKKLLADACGYVERERGRSDLPYVVLMDGMDHEGIHDGAPRLAAQLSEAYGCPVVFRPMSELPEELEEYLDEMPVRRGELIETACKVVEHNMLIPYTLSSRYDLKKANDLCQVLLEKWAQPLQAATVLSGCPISAGFLREAYRQLIQNHAHDSICGCSIDAVHRDMHYRFRQSQQISYEIIQDALNRLYVLTEGEGSDTRRLVIFNPLPFEREELVTVELWFQPGYPHQFCEQVKDQMKNAFRLLNAEGEEIPYGIREIFHGKFVDLPGSSYRQRRDVYRISFRAKLPAASSAEISVVPSEKPVRYLARLSTGIQTAENSRLSLKIEDNGTLTICDKQSGRRYEGLLNYIDDSETGDGWFHASAIAERAIAASGYPAGIELLADHPDFCVFRVVKRIPIPAAIERDEYQMRRSERETELRIVSDITLSREDDYIDVETRIENHAMDHRLRLLLPTGISGAYEAGTAFCSVCRKPGVSLETSDWKEVGHREKAFDGILLKRDEMGGLAFLSAGGLHECAGWEDARGTLAVTLFRSFGQTFLTNGEPDGQLLGELSFRYRLKLVAPEERFASLVRCRDALQAGVRAYTSGPVAPERVLGAPLWRLESRDVLLSTVKIPEDGEKGVLIVRLVNYAGEEAPACLRLAEPVRAAFRANLMEEQEGALDPVEGVLQVTLDPHEIATFRCIFDGQFTMKGWGSV